MRNFTMSWIRALMMLTFIIFIQIVLLMAMSIHLHAQGFGSIAFNVPINQKIEQNGVEYRVKSLPNIDVTFAAFFEGDEDTSWLGWGGSINPCLLDISSLPNRIKEKDKRFFCGFYTGPILRLSNNESFVPVINAQIGYVFTNLSPANSISWGDYSMKLSLDLVISNQFSIGATYRPYGMLIEDEKGYSRDTRSYMLKPAFEIRVAYSVVYF